MHTYTQEYPLTGLSLIHTCMHACIQEYPPAAITTSGTPTLVSGSAYSLTTIATWSATISGQPYGNGVYRITAPSVYTPNTLYPQWLVFDSETQDVGGVWKDNNYVNGVWNGSTSSMFTLDSSYYGDWVSLQLPEPIVLTSCTFIARSSFPNRVPSKFRIYGSNDGTNWTVLHDQTSALAYSSSKASVPVQTNASHTYIALVVSALPAGTSSNVLNFVQWSIFGKVKWLCCCKIK
jgi:hypothetical protein